MLQILLSGLAVAAAVAIASKLLPGVKVKKDGTLITVAVIFGLVNVFLGWIIKVIVALALLPAAIFTFGLAFLFFGVLVNTAILWIVDKLMDDFEVKSFGALVTTGFLVSVAGWVLRILVH